ncbi:MAG: hypothetical protein V3S64_00115 [bacterium]
MIQCKTLEEARTTRFEGVLYNGCGYFRSDYFGGREFNDRERPQGFYVEQASGSTVPPHFHEVDQFQVVTRGSGIFGRHAIGPLTVHYANAYTGYGPIHAGDGGLDYFTLRARHDSGARFLPEARPDQKRGPRRHLLAEAPPPLGEAQLLRLDSIGVEELMAPAEDGLGAWRVRMPPMAGDSEPLPALIGTRHGGCYLVVTGGALAGPDGTLPVWCCLFIPPGEKPLSINAASNGLEALMLRFPLPTLT